MKVFTDNDVVDAPRFGNFKIWRFCLEASVRKMAIQSCNTSDTFLLISQYSPASYGINIFEGWAQLACVNLPGDTISIRLIQDVIMYLSEATATAEP